MDREIVRAADSQRRTGSFEANWRERFAEFAANHDDEAGIAGWSATGLAARLRRFVSLWRQPTRERTWLDAGCGAGTYTQWLIAHGQAVVAVDYSWPTAVKAASRLHGVPMAVADVRQLPFRADRFDGAICFGVTQALAASESAVRELAAVLRPGGELWVDALNRHCVVHMLELAWRRWRRRPLHLRYERPADLVRVVQKAGLASVQLYWMPIAPTGWPRLQRALEVGWVMRAFALLPPLGALASHSFIVRGVKPAKSPTGSGPEQC